MLLVSALRLGASSWRQGSCKHLCFGKFTADREIGTSWKLSNNCPWHQATCILLGMFHIPSQCWARPHQPVPTASCLRFKPCSDAEVFPASAPCPRLQERKHPAGVTELEMERQKFPTCPFSTWLSHLSASSSQKRQLPAAIQDKKNKPNDLVLFCTASYRPNSSAKLHPHRPMIKQFHIPTRKSGCQLRFTGNFHAEISLDSASSSVLLQNWVWLRAVWMERSNFGSLDVRGLLWSLKSSCWGWVLGTDDFQFPCSLYTSYITQREVHLECALQRGWPIFQAETTDSLLIYICTKILTSLFGQNRKNNS